MKPNKIQALWDQYNKDWTQLTTKQLVALKLAGKITIQDLYNALNWETTANVDYVAEGELEGKIFIYGYTPADKQKNDFVYKNYLYMAVPFVCFVKGEDLTLKIDEADVSEKELWAHKSEDLTVKIIDDLANNCQGDIAEANRISKAKKAKKSKL